MRDRDLYVKGMHGLGDGLHSRALIRQWMGSGLRVWLETPWPCLQHDLVGDRLHLIDKRSPLRTQAKNAQREAQRYERAELPRDMQQMRVWYTAADVREHGSVLHAMIVNSRLDVTRDDFRLPIDPGWQEKAGALLAKWRPAKPLLIYRPLVERTEWSGCAARNPDHCAYAALFRSIRDRYFVVSIADLVSKVEWLVGERVEADVELHAGELDIETLAALVQRAALVYCSPGFAVVLAQAVGTPVVCVLGGYENSWSFSAGAKFAPYLGIDPINPCQCFSHSHPCRKAIDMPSAMESLSRFSERSLA